MESIYCSEGKSHLPRLWSQPSFTIATSFIMAGMSLEKPVYVKRPLFWNSRTPAEGSTRGMRAFPLFSSFPAISKRIKRRVHHHLKACRRCITRDTTGSSFHCCIVALGFFCSIIITNLKQGLSSPQEFILAGGGAKTRLAKVLHWAGWSWADSQYYQELSELQVDSRPYLVDLHVCNTTSLFATIKILKYHKDQFAMFPGKTSRTSPGRFLYSLIIIY